MDQFLLPEELEARQDEILRAVDLECKNTSASQAASMVINNLETQVEFVQSYRSLSLKSANLMADGKALSPRDAEALQTLYRKYVEAHEMGALTVGPDDQGAERAWTELTMGRIARLKSGLEKFNEAEKFLQQELQASLRPGF